MFRGGKKSFVVHLVCSDYESADFSAEFFWAENFRRIFFSRFFFRTAVGFFLVGRPSANHFVLLDALNEFAT